MIMHMCVGSTDLERSGKFYDAIVAELGGKRVNQTATAIFWGGGDTGIGFAATLPYDGNTATFGNGTMATLAAKSRDQVDRVHAAALASGGTDEGAPGVRAHGGYAAYWRDPDGNKMNVVALG